MRALRNTALDLVAAGDTAFGASLAQTQFEKAENMTDRLAAMSTLALIGGDARERAFARFYDEFAGDALVVDKWFTLQACIPEVATTRRVHALMAHREFSLADPNRVRALIGVCEWQFDSLPCARWIGLRYFNRRLFGTRFEKSPDRRASVVVAALLAHA